ncbi:hypothetical protein Q8F55_008736 [Vanrija albida]|uniref:Uncharacterized protein n=1 Tax=Vanrija albida TaxID=181172 RepID=A0ABR3PRN5_9TREE
MSPSTPTRRGQHGPSPGPSKPLMAESPSLGDDTLLTDTDVLDFSSSDDEAGVFFGAHRPVERKIIAALSRSTPGLPATPEPAAAPARRPSLANRVKKRDSREFVRRKTLLPGTEPPTGEKVWEGGFFEKPSEDEDESNSAGPSKSTPRDEAEVTTVLESMRIDEHSPEPEVFIEHDEEMDKENTVIPEQEYSSEEDDLSEGQPVDDVTVTLGFIKGNDSDDFSMNLDMGGLSVLDIDDPEVGHLERANDADCDIFFGSSGETDGSSSLNSSLTTDSEGAKDESTPSPADPFVEDSAPLAQLPTAVESTDESDADAADISYASDMNSPVGRGPVVIPVFAVPSPTKSTSTPLRGLEPRGFQDEVTQAPTSAGKAEGVSLPALDSPPAPFTHATPSRLAPLPTPTSVRLSESTPASQRPMSSSVQSQKLNRVLKSSSVLGSTTENVKKTAKEEAEAAERGKALRNQLEAAFTPKVSSLGASSKAMESPAAARLVRESPVSRPMLGGLSGYTGGPAAPSAPAPVFQSALSQPAFRSPIRPMTQAKRAFGDGPSRVAATPTPQRMLGMGTPSRGLGTPLRAHLAGPVRRAPMSDSKRTIASMPSAVTMVSSVPEEPKPVDNDGSEGPEAGSEPGDRAQGDDSEADKAEDNAASQVSESTQVGTAESESVSTATSSEAVSAELPSESTESTATPATMDEAKPETETTATPQANQTPVPQPEPEEPGRRSRRVPRPRTVPVVQIAAPKPRAPPAVVPSIAPGMSEKELKAATTRNTMRNQVYYCSIDRQIVRIPGPRPPSPGAKIRTAAEREEAERKVRREQRARRRNRGDDESSDEESTPLVERVPHQARAPGDEEDYMTPARPRKRLRVDDDEENDDSSASSGDSRQVRWDKGLTVIRGGLGEYGRPSKEAAATPTASSLKQAAQIPLDPHGNWAERHRHVDRTKPAKVVVTAVFYDGEEPVPVPSAGTRSKKK